MENGKEILTPEKLSKLVNEKHLVPLSVTDAETLIGYMEGHGYCLLADKSGQVYRHDLCKGGPDEESEIEEYSIQDAVLFAIEMNEALLDENPEDSDYRNDLLRDSDILIELRTFLNC